VDHVDKEEKLDQLVLLERRALLDSWEEEDRKERMEHQE